MSLQNELKTYLLQQGASDIGFGLAPDPPDARYPFTLSLVAKLSDAVVDEITDAPTATYFHHYRAVNALLDQLVLKAGLFLEQNGWRYLPVAASQSMNGGGWNYEGRYSHKKAACAAGLGTVGKSSLFLHRDYGARVRLATLFTDCPFEVSPAAPLSPCGGCTLCVRACPSGAILGGEWSPTTIREEIFNPEACSLHMKSAYQHIGRGAVCGICMRVCPKAIL